MFLPIRLVWNLQMVRSEKVGILILFSGGWVCITFATLRAIQVGVQHGKAVSPDPKWLTLWTVIEVSMGKLVQENAARVCYSFADIQSSHRRWMLPRFRFPYSKPHQHPKTFLQRTRLSETTWRRSGFAGCRVRREGLRERLRKGFLETCSPRHRCDFRLDDV